MRFEAEEHYLENRSATYDLIIMAVTVMYVVRKVLSRLSPAGLRASMAVLALFAVVGLTGCATAGPVIPQESAVVSKTRVGERDAASHPATQDVERVEIMTAAQGEPESQYRVGPGDTLSINIFGEPGMSDLRVPIDADGYIQLPVLQRSQVGGKTTTEIQADLIESYRVEFNNPWVVVVVADYGSRPLYLLGEFNAPGMVYLDRPTNIIQALGRGKGLSEDAYLRGARLLRQNDLVPVDINGLLKNGQADQNMWLESGDTIFVPSKDEQKIIVLGAVNQPGAIVYDNEGMGLVEAIAQAKDIRRSVAKMEEVRIIRSLSTVSGEFITIDAERIFSGLAPDFPLHPGDVVYVPQSALGDWNDVVAAIKPSFDLVVTSLQPFVQLKVLADL